MESQQDNNRNVRHPGRHDDSASKVGDITGVTPSIVSYREGEITWHELVVFFEKFPWRTPNLPDAGDYLGWDELPDTMQPGSWGEVIGAHLDELLTDDECKALMDVYDLTVDIQYEITMGKPGVVPLIDNDCSL